MVGGVMVGLAAYNSGETIWHSILAGIAWPLFLPVMVIVEFFA
jgi:hypothetical protein